MAVKIQKRPLIALVWVSLIVLSGCAVKQTVTLSNTIQFAPQPGGGLGPLIPLRPEKRAWTTVDDPEALAFASVRDVREKAAQACGVDRIEYEQTGPELLIGSGQTADLIHARALLLWCRGYTPPRREGAVLTVRFNVTGDLIRETIVSLKIGTDTEVVAKTEGTFRIIQNMFTSAGSAVQSLSGGQDLNSKELARKWCEETYIDMNFMPFTGINEYGEGDTAVLRGDASQLYTTFTAIDDCNVSEPVCSKKPLSSQDLDNPPRMWIQGIVSSNLYPRPGVSPDANLALAMNGYWQLEDGVPRIRTFTEARHISNGPCAERPTPILRGFSEEEEAAFLSRSPIIDDSEWAIASYCTISTYETGVKPISGTGYYVVDLTPSDGVKVRLTSTEIYLKDGRVFILAGVYVDRSATPSITNGCYTTIMN